MSCIFCKIVAGEIPAQVLERTDDLLVFKDINPMAPEHILVIPREHIEDLTNLQGKGELAATLLEKCAEMGSRLGGTSGYRVVTNTGKDGGQTVGHLHFHVLAGRSLGWPPG